MVTESRSAASSAYGCPPRLPRTVWLPASPDGAALSAAHGGAHIPGLRWQHAVTDVSEKRTKWTCGRDTNANSFPSVLYWVGHTMCSVY